MAADPNVFVMGEEVGEYQGAYKITEGLLDKYGPERVVNTPINEAGLELVLPIMNSMFHKRTKHIDVWYHWIRDAIEDGMFELNKVHTDDNAFDMLTKAVAREKLKICCSFAGMANSSS
nr:pyruvate dehydrogenase E1 component subunit beta-1, mitochondrial-like isoform X2 [Tanacetum cinerariifolium]